MKRTGLALIPLAGLLGSAFTLAIPAKADLYCGANNALDPATNTCKPIYSRPTGGCDPNTVGGFQNCLGGGPWMPESTAPPTTAQIYEFICNSLIVNSDHRMTVDSVEGIYHLLYEDPYRMTGRDAGRAVAMAVRVACPQFQSQLDQVVRQATG